MRVAIVHDWLYTLGGAERVLAQLQTCADFDSLDMPALLNALVADGAALPEGAVLPFDLGPITGFLRRSGGRVQAVSGICTHQGCRLELTDSRTEIGCPCHGATFNLAGTNLTHPRVMGHPLPALPRLPVRELDGQIEIYAPMPQMPQTHAASPAVEPSPGATSPDGGTGA